MGGSGNLLCVWRARISFSRTRHIRVTCSSRWFHSAIAPMSIAWAVAFVLGGSVDDRGRASAVICSQYGSVPSVGWKKAKIRTAAASDATEQHCTRQSLSSLVISRGRSAWTVPTPRTASRGRRTSAPRQPPGSPPTGARSPRRSGPSRLTRQGPPPGSAGPGVQQGVAECDSGGGVCWYPATRSSSLGGARDGAVRGPGVGRHADQRPRDGERVQAVRHHQRSGFAGCA
jgi:hypothetical protein